MYGYIYETTNLINGKKYIGKKTSNIFLKEDYLGSGVYLKRAIRKYGKENFKVRLIEEINTNQEDLCKREVYWIDKTNAIKSSDYYNIGAGGIGWNNSVNFKDAKDNHWLGRHHSEETIKKMSKSHKGKPWTKAQRESLLPTRQGKNNPRYGAMVSRETREKISRSLKEYYKTRSPKDKNKPLSKETKKKISDSLKLYYKTKQNKE